MIRDEEQVIHKDFSGLRNNVAAGEFDRSDLQVALNVEINDRRVIQRRTGFSEPVVAGSTHSLWAGAGVCLAVQGSSLLRVASGYATTTLRSDLTPNLPMSYYAVGARVYYSNGVQTGAVDEGRSRSWGLEVPARISAQEISGSFRAGRYQFALTYVRSDGQESGAPAAGVLDLAAPGGFRFSALPVSSDADVLEKNLYLSSWNGEVLYLRARLAADETTIDVTAPGPETAFLQTQHLSPPPAGEIVSYYNGRMVVAEGAQLHPSMPYSYELFDRREVIRFDSRTGMVAPVRGGVFVGTETQIVFLRGGDLSEVVYDVRAQYGVIPGTLAEAQADTVGEGADGKSYVVASKQGLCLLADGGAFKNLTQERFSYPSTAAGSAIVRRHRGMNQYVAVLRGGTETAANQHI